MFEVFLNMPFFYGRSINDFFKVSKPLCNILENDKQFIIKEAYLKALTDLKKEIEIILGEAEIKVVQSIPSG